MSFGQFAEVQTIARKVSEHLLDATSTWDSTTTHKITVPADTRWFLLNVYVWRTVSSTAHLQHKNAADKVLSELIYSAATTGGLGLPNGIGAVRSIQLFYPLVMDAGEYISFLFSVAQDATAYIAYSYLEIPYP